MANETRIYKYETSLGDVELGFDDVKNYLVKGNKNLITEGEVLMFMAVCRAQKLNPFVSGEVHLIKYSENESAQIVIGYDTYKRRADENPSFLRKESGIVVLRGNEVVKKEGACLYPTEVVIGGWCKVFKIRHDKEVCVYKEVSMTEYNKGKSTWKDKPCTMIEKVAVSQALREAFPKDYEGTYTSEEMSSVFSDAETPKSDEPVVVDCQINNGDRKHLFAEAQRIYGKEKGNERIKELLEELGLESTVGMKYSQYNKVLDALLNDEVEHPADGSDDAESSDSTDVVNCNEASEVTES